MILPGHIGAGYLIGYAVLEAARSYVAVSGGPITTAQVKAILIIAAALGSAPDVDGLLHLLRNRTVSPDGLIAHRSYPTHAPLPWLVLGLSVWIVGRIVSSPFTCVSGLLIWLCPWSHLALDSLEGGVVWLWPFSDRRYAVLDDWEGRPGARNWRDLFKRYAAGTKTFWLELAVTVAAATVLLVSSRL